MTTEWPCWSKMSRMWEAMKPLPSTPCDQASPSMLEVSGYVLTCQEYPSHCVRSVYRIKSWWKFFSSDQNQLTRLTLEKRKIQTHNGEGIYRYLYRSLVERSDNRGDIPRSLSYYFRIRFVMMSSSDFR